VYYSQQTVLLSQGTYPRIGPQETLEYDSNRFDNLADFAWISQDKELCRVESAACSLAQSSSLVFCVHIVLELCSWPASRWFLVPLSLFFITTKSPNQRPNYSISLRVAIAHNVFSFTSFYSDPQSTHGKPRISRLHSFSATAIKSLDVNCSWSPCPTFMVIYGLSF
jgi:hypothetical protein